MGLPTALSIVRNFKYNKTDKKATKLLCLKYKDSKKRCFLSVVKYTSIFALLQTLSNHLTLYFLTYVSYTNIVVCLGNTGDIHFLIHNQNILQK